MRGYRMWGVGLSALCIQLGLLGCRDSAGPQRAANRTYEDRRKPKDVEEPVKETKVVFWHPEKPLVFKGEGSPEARARGDYDQGAVELNVHEVEIRLGPLEHETYTVILRLKIDLSTLNVWIDKSRFGFIEGIFRNMRIPWDPARPIDVELHFSRHGDRVELHEHLDWLQRRADKPAGFDATKELLAALSSGGEHFLAQVMFFQLRSVRQTVEDGTIIGFDYQDVEALRKRIHERYAPTKGAGE